MLPRCFLGNKQSTISREMKRSEHEADHSHPPNAKVSTPPYVSRSAKYNVIIHIYSMVLPDYVWKKA
jgi:IS30 family transposase